MSRFRAVCLAGFFLVCVGAVVVRLWLLQIAWHQRLSERAERQLARRDLGEPRRGRILDRSGHVLALSLEGASCFAYANRVTDPERIAHIVSASLNLPETELRQRLQRARGFVWLARRCVPQQLRPLRRFEERGVGIVSETRRAYPEGSLAAHVLGAVGADLQGLSGIEAAVDRWLSEVREPIVPVREAGGATRAVVLTLDRDIQTIAEQELVAQMELSRAKSGTVIIEDPRTGEILAMASAPAFDPNRWWEESAHLHNPAVEKVFEPGSTFKMITAAALLEEGLVKPEDRFFCENGAYQWKGLTIHDHEKDGWLTFQQVIAHSSNIGTAKAAMRLGSEKLYRYARAFGFGSSTGIGLPGETSGILRNPGKWSGVSLPMVSFGQEVGVTALQIVDAYAAIANQGVLLEPCLISGFMDGRNEFRPAAVRRVVRRVVSQATAKILTGLLQEVVASGTGMAARIEGMDVAGKTGTAQKFDARTGTYSTDRYVASFCGFYPANDPRVVIGVFLDEPKGDYWGGSLAAPLFARIGQGILPYLRLEVLPDRSPSILRLAKTS